jgi:hypothetical protein
MRLKVAVPNMNRHHNPMVPQNLSATKRHLIVNPLISVPVLPAVRVLAFVDIIYVNRSPNPAALARSAANAWHERLHDHCVDLDGVTCIIAGTSLRDC